LFSVGLHGCVAKSTAESPHGKRLIVVFLRGGIDGLNVVVPYQESAYYEARPKIGIPAAGQEEGVLNLDGYFGLHPALSSLMPLWQQKSLAFVHACGSPASTRSHFDAQDYIESGTPGNKTTRDGWMNRLLMALSPTPATTQGLNLGSTIPRIFSGDAPVTSMELGNNADRRLPVDRETMTAAFNQLYSGNDPLSQAYQQGREARDRLLENLRVEMEAADNGAPSPRGFAGEAQRLGGLMARDPAIQLAFLSLGGWDTHANQGSSRGLLSRNLQSLAEGLSALVQRLGPVYQETAIVVLSEFGRTVRENGNQGTDHGHGNVVWLLGGGLRGGQVYGQWPGLDESDLYQERDLAVTTDFRDAIGTLFKHHLHLDDGKIHQIFPGFQLTQPLNFL
jgi:uncharacterized protein (DUF1501 family)